MVNKNLTYNDFIEIFKKIKEEDTLKITDINKENIDVLLKFSAYSDEFMKSNDNYPSILTEAYLKCGNTLSNKFKEVFKTKSEKKLLDFIAQIPKDVLIGKVEYGTTYLEPSIRIINTFNEFAYEKIIEFINNLYDIE
jgi:hypothetical protein